MAVEQEQVVIIGSGCAGWTAAIYTARANLSPLVLTGEMPGGLLTTTSIVENFPGFPEGIDGYELMTAMQKQAERFGARARLLQTVSDIDLSKRPFTLTVNGEKIQAGTVIVAAGAGHKHLGLESERQLEKKGVTYCATCDGALPAFRNQPLVVVGGGDSALEEAMYLTRFASKVLLIHRRDSLRASQIMQDRARANSKIEFVWDSVIEEILDVKKDHVTAVRVKNLKTQKSSEIPCAGVFIAIGHEPNTKIFRGKLEMDEQGYILCKQGSATSVPGIFAAGDCVDSVYRQAITAAGMGCAAAIDAERFLAIEAGAVPPTPEKEWRPVATARA
ncbi:MAG: thioredoxin-disulfide reductase [Verrucomicrobiae bacterium]|nr:thioredoxin-disulfide reductase [Verrucomicrobiae bacterium]